MENIMLRKAVQNDWEKILDLIRHNPDTLAQKHLPHVDEFVVALQGGEVVGCGALVEYSKRLAEVRSLAVADFLKGKGIGQNLVTLCEMEARRGGIEELLAITGNEALFRKLEFNPERHGKVAMLKRLTGNGGE